MGKKIVYVFVGVPGSEFEYMAYLSMLSLSMSNPDIKKVLLLDMVSAALLKQSDSLLIHFADQLIEVDVPYDNNKMKSRYLKTLSGTFVDSPFILIDVDTLVLDDISEVYRIGGKKIMMAVNHSSDKVVGQINVEEKNILNKEGYGEVSRYYNSGVIYYGDSCKSERISVDWNKAWLKIGDKYGYYSDQPALHMALQSYAEEIECLDKKWNAQILMNPSLIKDAKIIHYYSDGFGGEKKNITRYHDYLKSLDGIAEISKGDVLKLLEKNNIWNGKPWVINTLVGRLEKCNYPPYFLYYLLANDLVGFGSALVKYPINQLRKWFYWL